MTHKATGQASFDGHGRFLFFSYKLHMHITNNFSDTQYPVIPTTLSSANASNSGLCNFICAVVAIATF